MCHRITRDISLLAQKLRDFSENSSAPCIHRVSNSLLCQLIFAAVLHTVYCTQRCASQCVDMQLIVCLLNEWLSNQNARLSHGYG
jgi:hypothetical protein